MSGKLVRNTSDKESRDWWKAILTAAETAPKLKDKPAAQPSQPPAGMQSKPATSSPRKK